MMIVTVMLVAVFALTLGFLIGFSTDTQSYTKTKKPIKHVSNDSEIQKEYENFLNYDGTPQQ